MIVRLLKRLAAFLWWSVAGRWRRRLVALPLVFVLVTIIVGKQTMLISVGVIALALLVWWWLRRHQRRLNQSARDLGITNKTGEPPTIRRRVRRPGAVEVTYALPVGVTAEDLGDQASALADAHKAVRATVTPSGPGRCTVTYLRADPLAEIGPAPILSATGPVDARSRPVAVGVDERGDLVEMSLFSSSCLIGGNPNAGKSATMTGIVLPLALDPRIDLWLVDAKFGLELGFLAGCATRFADDLATAKVLLDDLLSLTMSRFEVLREAGRKKWAPEDGGIVLVIDELAEITGTGEKDSKEAANTLRRINALGRAAGCTTIAASQKCSADVIPTSIRDLFQRRVLLRTGSRAQAETIFPEAAAEAVTIPIDMPGTGYVNTNGGITRMRSWFIPDHEVTQVAQLAESIRSHADAR